MHGVEEEVVNHLGLLQERARSERNCNGHRR